MKVAGVVTEYNPFHNGHKYQLDEIKRITGADYTAVAMSGDFMQRGEPAVLDKYSRAEIALRNGADLVLEIPTIWATASAELFALGGVSLLAATGCVDYLCFGAENDNLEEFLSYSKLINNMDSDTTSDILAFQREGYSYPAAVEMVLRKQYPAMFPDEFWDKISLPNNTLAIEYLHALSILNSKIAPVLIKRQGDGYNRSIISTDSEYASATSIRNSLYASDYTWQDYVPSNAVSIIGDFADRYGLVFPNDISTMLIYRLLSEQKNGLNSYADCSDTLSGSINKHLNRFESFTQFADLIKSKNYTHTRITRCFLHILLQITKEDYSNGKALGYSPYLRVLGFNKAASPLMHAIKKEASCPLITKLADAPNILSSESQKILDKDIFAADIYNQLLISHSRNIPSNEYVHGPVIL